MTLATVKAAIWKARGPLGAAPTGCDVDPPTMARLCELLGLAAPSEEKGLRFVVIDEVWFYERAPKLGFFVEHPVSVEKEAITPRHRARALGAAPHCPTCGTEAVRGNVGGLDAWVCPMARPKFGPCSHFAAVPYDVPGEAQTTGNPTFTA
jgi:hypothetical protein